MGLKSRLRTSSRPAQAALQPHNVMMVEEMIWDDVVPDHLPHHHHLLDALLPVLRRRLFNPITCLRHRTREGDQLSQVRCLVFFMFSVVLSVMFRLLAGAEGKRVEKGFLETLLLLVWLLLYQIVA